MTVTGDEIRTAVRSAYAGAATSPPCCCAPEDGAEIGYDPADLAALPEDALMGLGCGNPVSAAEIGEGETVLDLGSGGGIDVFLAARKVGPSGRVIGVDMTPEMLQRAEAGANRAALGNVEFRLGLIERLPVATATVDVVVSNCVINLAPDKDPVFAEAFRVLRPGGRLVVSDIVTYRPMPQATAEDLRSWASCVAGALIESDYLEAVRRAGFVDVEVLDRKGTTDTHSITVRAVRPE